MKTPKVSIITVVYNDVAHIGQTIENVLKQTYPALEYIVVDGESTDGTLDVIKGYDKQLSWHSGPDKGIYDAMQKGAHMATGEWILFLNSGDFFFSPEAIYRIYEQYEDRGEDFLLANSRYFNEYGYKDMKPAILTKSYYDAMPVNHPSTFIRRTTQLRYPFNLKYRNSADYYFFVEAFSNGATYCYFDQLLSLFDNRAGASTTHYDRSIRENIDIMMNLGAPQKRIEQLQKSLKEYLIKQRIRQYLPLYGLLHQCNLKKQGWVKCELKTILKDI